MLQFLWVTGLTDIAMDFECEIVVKRDLIWRSLKLDAKKAAKFCNFEVS